MISRYTEPNHFGRSTYRIEFDRGVQYFEIHETNDNSLLVEFKEWMIIYTKTHFSFITKVEMNKALQEAVEYLYKYALTKKSWSFRLHMKDAYLRNLMKEVSTSSVIFASGPKRNTDIK